MQRKHIVALQKNYAIFAYFFKQHYFTFTYLFYLLRDKNYNLFTFFIYIIRFPNKKKILNIRNKKRIIYNFI